MRNYAIPHKLKIYFLGLFMLWNMIVGIVASKEYNHAQEHMMELVLQEARIFSDRDLVLRQWVASHKGVYAEINAGTPPNLVLANLPERDIRTPSGRKLTLMNPAYVLRQISRHFASKFGAIGHITSLTPKSIKNKAQPWERKALHALENGAKEFILPPESDMETYFHFMKPIIIQKNCLHCHSQQGFKEGNVGGGVSVTIPMAPFLEEKSKDWAIHRNKLLFFYILGSIAILWVYLFSTKRAKKFITVQQQLQESEIKYRTLFENTPEAVYWIGSDASFLNVNQVATAVLGYSREELLSMKVMDINPEVSTENWPSIWQELQKGATYRQAGNHQKKDGGLLPVHVTSNLVRLGTEEYTCSVVRDISAEKKASEKSRANLSQLAHTGRLTALGEMATGVAHELNQPLHIISLAAECLEESLATIDLPESKTSLRDIKEQLWRASKIITNMRDFARSGNEINTLIEVDAPVRMALSFFTEQFRIHGIDLSLEVSPNIPMVQADPQKIEQIIINLLTNARHAVEYKKEHLSQKPTDTSIEPYSMQVQVHLWGAPQKKLLFIEVEDNGMGMDKETTYRCLEPFFSRKEARKGTGLGLNIVHNLTTELRGAVTVRSQLHVMTKIQISLPGVF